MKALKMLDAMCAEAKRTRDPLAVVTYPLSAVVEVLPASSSELTPINAARMLGELIEEAGFELVLGGPPRPQLPPPVPRTLREAKAWEAERDADTKRAAVVVFRAVSLNETLTIDERVEADNLAAVYERWAERRLENVPPKAGR